MIVHKIGGATTRTARGLETLVDVVRTSHLEEVQLAKRRQKTTDRLPGLVTVISAIGHTTRHLNRTAELAEQGNVALAEEALSKIVGQHLQIAQALQLLDETKSEIFHEFESILTDIRALIEGVSITRELSLRTRDSFLASGERFALALIEPLLRERGLPVVRVNAQKVIITNEEFTHATPLLPEIEQRATEIILPHLRHAEIVLIQGFVGATRDGVTTTMGNESSDLTATLLAKALHAREVVIWKTVPGIFTADPELVPKAKLIKHLSFEEADEIGRRGARILFQNIASPFIGQKSITPIRVTSPRSYATRSTEIGVNDPQTARRIKPLAIGIESNLIPLSIHRNIYASQTENATASERRKREQTRSITKRAVFSLVSDSETQLLVKRDVRSSFLRELETIGTTVTEHAPISSISLTYRPSSIPGEERELAAQVLRSLRQFELYGFFQIEKSIVALVGDSEGEAALRKLHRDIFGS